MRTIDVLRIGLVFAAFGVGAPRGFAGHGHSGHHGSGGAGWTNPGGGHHHGHFPNQGFPGAGGAIFLPIVSPGFFFGPAFYPPAFFPAVYGPGPLIATPPQDLAGDARAAADEAKARAAHPPEPGRANQLVTLGDRLFRAGNTKKAEERYQQAVRSDPHAAAPRIRFAQLAFVRGQYAEAAHRLREAETVQPGWLGTALDIQSIYGEPGDFSRHIARLESHLHAHPEDRDAWLVLGAQWYLSGRTGKAADIFQRLNDPRRRPDIALAAFIDVTDAGSRQEPNPEAPAK